MVKRMFEKPWRPDLLTGAQEFPSSTVIPPISNIDCLSDKPWKEPTPPRKARTFPGVTSRNPLRPYSGEMPRKLNKFTSLPPISQIDFLSDTRAPVSGNDDFKNNKIPISNVPCLNRHEANLKYEDFNDILPSGRVAKKHHGIQSTDTEFIKLCKMNGRKNLLKEQEILNKSIGQTTREYMSTQKRTILRSPNEKWIPSDWVKFNVYGQKEQLR